MVLPEKKSVRHNQAVVCLSFRDIWNIQWFALQTVAKLRASGTTQCSLIIQCRQAMGVQITKRETMNTMEINTYCLVNYSLRNIPYKAKNICYYGCVPSTAKTDVCPTEYEKY
jgi:hypothetical protein